MSEYGYLLCQDDREFSERYGKMVADDPPEGPYVEIGDDSMTGPTFDEYLKDWPDTA